MSSTAVKRGLVVALFAISAGLVASCGGRTNGSIVLGPGAGPRAIGIAGDSLYKLATSPSNWSAPSQGERRCSGTFGCFFGGKVKVLLYAANNAKDHGPGTGGPNVLIGKMVNTGNSKARMYGMAPGPYHYLVYLVPGGNADTGRFIVEQVKNSPPHDHETVATGIQIGCNHPGGWTESFARFRSCAHGRPPSPAPRTSSGRRNREDAPVVHTAGMLGFLGIFQQFAGEDPSWYTCTSGCCTSGAPQ